MLKLNICVKKLFFFLAFVFLVAMLSFCEIKPAKADTVSNTKTFYSLPYDGALYEKDIDYAAAWNSGIADYVYKTSATIQIGQAKIPVINEYGLHRGFVFFDTSILPENANITAVVLSVYIDTDVSSTDFNLTIQNPAPYYPHTPLEASDYNRTLYSGDGGSRNTTTITGAGYWNITLNTDGISWVNTYGLTRFCLRSSREIAGTQPTGYEHIIIYSAESGVSYAPLLYVSYESGVYSYIIHGPLQEDSGLAYNGIINVSLTFPNINPVSFTLNGSSGNAENYTLAVTEQALFMNWNISSDYQHFRVYVFRDSYFDEVWLYVPNPDLTVLQYTISIIDFAGLTEATVEIDKNIGGYNRVIERANLDVYNGMTFWLTMYSQYTLKLISNEATITWGLLADGQQSKTFVVSKDMIPSEYTGENAMVSATRLNSTLINVYYYEVSTTWINSTVYAHTTTGYTQVFNQYDAGTTQNFNLTVEANLNYLVVIEACQNGSTYVWHFALAKPPSNTNILSGILDAFGIWPFDSANALGVFIVLCFFSVGSWRDTEFWLGVGIIIAGVLAFVGMLTVSWLGVSMALLVVCLMYVHKGKVEDRGY